MIPRRVSLFVLPHSSSPSSTDTTLAISKSGRTSRVNKCGNIFNGGARFDLCDSMSLNTRNFLLLTIPPKLRFQCNLVQVEDINLGQRLGPLSERDWGTTYIRNNTPRTCHQFNRFKSCESNGRHRNNTHLSVWYHTTFSRRSRIALSRLCFISCSIDCDSSLSQHLF